MALSAQASPHVEQRLQKEIIIWLSTVRADGRPHLVPVWFLWQDGKILIFSKPDQKIRNLHANSNVMLALEALDSGEDIVLIEGQARMSQAEQLSATMPAYKQKYAEGMQRLGITAEQMASTYNQAIVITPTRFNAWKG